MKKYISKNTAVSGIAVLALVSAGAYFISTEFSVSPAPEISAAPKQVDNTDTPSNTTSISIDASTDKQKIEADNPVTEKIAETQIEENKESPLNQEDLLLPAPSVENISTEASGEFAEQINQQSITDQAMTDGYQVSKSDPEAQLPDSKNLTTEAKGEYAAEINPSSIQEKAKSDGYPPPEVDPGSHPPTTKNISSDVSGESGSEVSQQAILEKARQDGWLSN